jgi:hypothetical protein
VLLAIVLVPLVMELDQVAAMLVNRTVVMDMMASIALLVTLGAQSALELPTHNVVIV